MFGYLRWNKAMLGYVMLGKVKLGYVRWVYVI